MIIIDLTTISALIWLGFLFGIDRLMAWAQTKTVDKKANGQAIKVDVTHHLNRS